MADSKTPVGMRVVQLRVDCDSVIEWAESDSEKWEKSETTDEVPDGYRTSDTLFIPFHSYENPPAVHDMHQQVYDAVRKYSSDFHFEFDDFEDASLQRYAKGQEYKYHYDSDPEQVRIVSAVLYLNSVSGGETYFKNFDYAVRPKPGRLAIFPSDYVYMHRALPVKKGTKYAVAYWAMP